MNSSNHCFLKNKKINTNKTTKQNRKVYDKYSKKVYAFYPSLWSIKHTFGFLKPGEEWESEVLKSDKGK